MADPYRIEARVRLGKNLPPETSVLPIGPYELRALPPGPAGEPEAVLGFANAFEHGGKAKGSNPEGECSIVCRLLTLLFDSRVEVVGVRIGTFNVPRRAEIQASSQETIPSEDYGSYLDRVLRLNPSLAEQYLRACNAYALAFGTARSEPTLAFLLLVVAIECLSSQDGIIPFTELDPAKKNCERFCRFIQKHAPEAVRRVETAELFTRLLKTVYYSHRSGFAHAGKEVSEATRMADQLGQSHFKHYPNGKETMTPGLRWFTTVVRLALLRFLDDHEKLQPEPDAQMLGRMAFERVTLQVKVKRAVQDGEPIISTDLDTQ